MGDFRKYLNGESLPERVLQGIDNHQRVDRFTDNHPLVADARRLFSPGRRRFAGIILDVVFDHFLIRHWHNYYADEAPGFIQASYDDLDAMQHFMPARMQQVVGLMRRHDWLSSYGELSGVGRALDGISSRIRFKNDFAGAIDELEQHYDRLEQNFLGFYPDLVTHIEHGRIASR